jgi:glucose-6-phosphate isomerase
VFEGNRPSLSLLADVLNARTLGQLLALYEHRTAVEGFLWGINSFDQWGVELGKKLAGEVRKALQSARGAPGGGLPQAEVARFVPSTVALLQKYVGGGGK